jgi:predicted RNA-binding Zn ribbon-like protein
LVVTRTAADLELAGGNLALDLVNTRDGHSPATDYLGRPDDLVLWARHAAGLEVDADEAVLDRVLALRETVDAVFRPLAVGRRPDSDDLDALVAAQVAGRLVAAGDRFELSWDRDIVGPLAAAAVDLLRSDQLDRLQVCEACPWLFLDLSRNRSRRWCSMNVCGGTLKMRRYRARKRATARGRPGTGSSA